MKSGQKTQKTRLAIYALTGMIFASFIIGGAVYRSNQILINIITPGWVLMSFGIALGLSVAIPFIIFLSAIYYSNECKEINIINETTPTDSGSDGAAIAAIVIAADSTII